MRNRFFVIILISLIVSAIGINLVHVKFFKNQRLKLIDRQIAESSSALLDSAEFLRDVNTPKRLDDTISKVLQGARIGKVFILRRADGKILYESFNVALLRAELPLRPEWVAVETENEYTRVRNVPLAGGGLILQVGLVLDRNFLNWEIIDRRVVNYVTGIVLALFLASALMTWLLLSPLRLLIEHLRFTTSTMENLKDVGPLPAPLRTYRGSFWNRADEFSGLLSTVQKLMERINFNNKLTRSWTFQMAHELKTPLAIIRAETQHQHQDLKVSPEFSRLVTGEVDHMTEIISQFLDWAELENMPYQRDLHALRLRTAVAEVAARLEKVYPGRLILKMEMDFSVFANPVHLEQMIQNLMGNALKYSFTASVVEVLVSHNSLRIRDVGPGIPKAVRDRLGQPFNVGPRINGTRTGSGLGLAWVMTVAKLYQWPFELHETSAGTEVVVRFPVEET